MALRIDIDIISRSPPLTQYDPYSANNHVAVLVYDEKARRLARSFGSISSGGGRGRSSGRVRA